jgi:hypothetical protein
MCFYKFENKSARILHISVGDGQTLAIPPSESGVTLEIEDSQKPALQANIATPAVQAWIDDGQLTITRSRTRTRRRPSSPEAAEGDRAAGCVRAGGAMPEAHAG